MITVKVANFPGAVHEVVLEDDATAQDAFAAAGITPSGSDLTVDGLPATPGTVLSDNARVISAKGAKGG